MSRPEAEKKDSESLDRSFLEAYLAGWTIRSSTPSLTPGDEYEVFVSEYNEESESNPVYIGDTVVSINDGSPDLFGKKVRIRVTDFDSDDYVGEAELIEIVGEGTY